MSIVPTDNPFSGNLFGAPKDAFEYLLDAIIATVPSKREALVKPHLQVFTAHPVIKELISQGKAPAPTEDIPPANLELKQIQNTLSTLSKALERLSKGNPPSKNPSPSTRKKQKGRENNQQPQHTYSAVVGSRPPNPSLVVDLVEVEVWRVERSERNWSKDGVLVPTMYSIYTTRHNSNYPSQCVKA